MSEESLPNLNIRRDKKQPKTSKQDTLPQLHLKQRQSASQRDNPHFSPSSQNSAPGYQEQERYQPEGGKWRLGRDIQTGQYIDAPQHARRQGVYIIGATGTGKTGLIENLIIQDIKQGMGVGLLDPHGDLTDAVLSRLPDTRFVDGVERITEEDVILLDIKNTQYPFGLNLFSCPDPSDLYALSVASAHVMHIFRKLWGKGGVIVEDAWGVLLEKILKNATTTLLENPGYTMAEIPLLLDVVNPAFRMNLVQNLTSDAVRDFWEGEFGTLSTRDQREEIQSTLTRVNSFLSEQIIRNIIGQSRTTINFRSIMDERKILLVRLNIRLGEGITTLLGTMIIAGILDAAYSRADLPMNKRKQFNLYADEFQRFASEDFATLLTEARKFGIATTIAHQTRSQLDAQNRGAALNVANLVVFKVNSTDAQELAPDFAQKPEEAWEQELEAERLEVREKERMETVEVEEYVEEDIEEITTSPVDFLTGARTTYTNTKVREAIGEVIFSIEQNEGVWALLPFERDFYFKKEKREERGFIQSSRSLVNKLLVDVMEKRVALATEKFAHRVEEVVRKVFHMPTYDWNERLSLGMAFMSEYGRDRLAGLQQVQSDFILELVGGHTRTRLQTLKRDVIEAEISFNATKLAYDNLTSVSFGDTHSLGERLRSEKNGQESYQRVRQDRERYWEKRMWEEGKVEAQIAEIVAFVSNLKLICEALAADPIMVPTDKKRMVKRIRPQLVLHPEKTFPHPRKAITHPQPTEQEMINRMVRELINLPLHTARVKIATDTGIEEHKIRTLAPESGLVRAALFNRIQRITEHNRQAGYIQARQDVEAEIRQRQAQWREPPEPQPVTRRPK